MKKITDKQRLDFYDKNKDTATYYVYRYMRFNRMSVRQAIDAAMRAEAKRKP